MIESNGVAVRCELSEDRTKLQLVVSADHFGSTGQPLKLNVELVPAAVDTMLADISKLREVMPQPPVRELEVGGALRGINDPSWRHSVETMVGNSVLSLRHPGLGWLHFILPKEKAGRLGHLLVSNSERPPPHTPEIKN